jgi:hypothetical protein
LDTTVKITHTSDGSITTDPNTIILKVAGEYSRYDADNDGVITTADISLILFNHYLLRRGQLGWDAAQTFDANGDGIIDLVDLITISTYTK